ncbi:MAG: cobalamin biosynthesis protein [Halofilum sp. (in: g-proteobacteria)]|nr:cobalamin biosynthesis protein [Halofilum sp. (in: g-proteobacteria)]
MTATAPDTTVWVAGIGCRRACPADEIVALLDAALAECGLTAKALARIATVEHKAHERGLAEAAEALGLSLSCWPSVILQQYEDRIATRSPMALEATGSASVAEAAALAEASRGDPGDPHTVLALPRRSSARATVAIACRRGDGGAFHFR